MSKKLRDSAVIRFLWRLLLALALLPVALTALYAFLPPVSTLMLGRWLLLKPVERSYVPYEAIAPVLVASVVASEDAQFCRHGGVDWDALREVIDDAEDGAPSRGASTIPMQTAKNLFLWPSRSYIRKALEIPLALLIDLGWSKKRLITVYLNIAEWGDGIFGIEAAARSYFSKSARQLTAHEAALLAAALPNPSLRNPSRPSPGHRRLAAKLEGRAQEMGPWLDCLR